MIVCRHFDPNGSGSIHYGEFMWAFFNRRKMARKYKRHIEGLTEEQINSKFHYFDRNGDGTLSPNVNLSFNYIAHLILI